LVKLQEDLLSQVFGEPAVRKEMPADAEDHALVLANDLGKRSEIALQGLSQGHVHPGFRFRVQGPLYRNNTQVKAIRAQAFVTKTIFSVKPSGRSCDI
jgi:hypothetical protein